jgi:hypothetical protein
MIQSFQFIVALVVTQHILSNTRPLSQALQKADCDIVKACVDANTCKKVIREQREDSVDVVIEKRRTARRMAHRSTAGEIDDMAMQYFKVNVFFPFVDHCLMQLGQRFPAKKQACSWHLNVSYASDYYNNDTNRNCENHWLVHCRPTPKCNFSTGNPPMEYVLSKSYRQAILPIWCFHFSRPGLLPKHSRYLPHSTNHGNRIRIM